MFSLKELLNPEAHDFRCKICFLPYIGNSVTGEKGNDRAVLPEDNYKIELNEGAIQLLGDDNVITVRTDNPINLEINMEDNTVEAYGEGDVMIKCATVEGASEYEYVKAEGEFNGAVTIGLDKEGELHLEGDTGDMII